jgi:hypothetical protein
LLQISQTGLEVFAKIGFFFVAHPFGLRFGALMKSGFVVEAAVKTTLYRIVTFRAGILTGDFIRYLDFVFAIPAIYCI